MKAAIESILEHYGASCSVEGSTMAFKAFLQPITASKNPALYTQFGESPQEHYLFLGPAEPYLYRGDVLIMNGRKYALERTEAVMLGDTVLYRWGTCKLKRGDQAWS